MPKKDSKMIRRRLRAAYLSSSISISLVLLLVGAATLLVVNARSVASYFKESMQISVLLTTNATDADAQKYSATVAALPCTRECRVVSREEGTRELEQMLGKDFLSVFESSAVPLSVDVTLKADYVSADSLGKVRAMLAASPLVDEVECRQSLVEGLNSNLTRISLIIGILTVLLLAISLALIGNTVRLSVFSRRFTIRTMDLVGATRGFIMKPFLKGAVVQGLVAAAVAIGIIFGALALVQRSFPQMMAMFSKWAFAISAAVVVVVGVGICALSTFLVVSRITGIDKEELYY